MSGRLASPGVSASVSSSSETSSAVASEASISPDCSSSAAGFRVLGLATGRRRNRPRRLPRCCPRPAARSSLVLGLVRSAGRRRVPRPCPSRPACRARRGRRPAGRRACRPGRRCRRRPSPRPSRARARPRARRSSARRGRSASRAPSAPWLPRSARRPCRARRQGWPWRTCPQASSRYCRRRPSWRARRSLRRAPARPRRRRRAPACPPAPASCGCGCRGRRASAPWNRRGPRVIAISLRDGFLGSSGRRARLPASAGLSLAKATSSSWSPAMARMHTLTRALEIVRFRPLSACPRVLSPGPAMLEQSLSIRGGNRPSSRCYPSTTLTANSGSSCAEGALIELGNQRPLELVALVEEGEAERTCRRRRRFRRSPPR